MWCATYSIVRTQRASAASRARYNSLGRLPTAPSTSEANPLRNQINESLSIRPPKTKKKSMRALARCDVTFVPRPASLLFSLKRKKKHAHTQHNTNLLIFRRGPPRRGSVRKNENKNKDRTSYLYNAMVRFASPLTRGLAQRPQHYHHHHNTHHNCHNQIIRSPPTPTRHTQKDPVYGTKKKRP